VNKRSDSINKITKHTNAPETIMDQMNPEMQVTDVEVAPKVIIHDNHEISMSKSQCYKAAKNAMEIHNLLKMVDNLESWMQAKITLAAEYLECVASNLEYDVVSATLEEGISEPIQEDHDFPYSTPQLVKLGQTLLAKIPSIKSDATANKLSALADKLVNTLNADFRSVYRSFYLLYKISKKNSLDKKLYAEYYLRLFYGKL
jgi:hypothetical protein